MLNRSGPKHNAFQLHNIRLASPEIIRRLKNGDWRNTIAPALKCVECGGRVTTPNVAFWGYDVSRTLCYSCAQKLRLKIRIEKYLKGGVRFKL
jgi:hypothetical protein